MFYKYLYNSNIKLVKVKILTVLATQNSISFVFLKKKSKLN